MAALGYHPTVVVGDGAEGLAEHAPFDAIIATCAVPVVPLGVDRADHPRRGGPH
ncbi:hypothetical protein [Saccharomonospora sp.]|uniref:hypothetical protein n=1 Tax=Saccharomonospora sp. TaxID=33913 RepID=UPI0026192E30|nr:hypothetical protein [Saccharomonospora sp.]